MGSVYMQLLLVAQRQDPRCITILLNQVVFSWVFLSGAMSITQVGHENKLGTIQNAVSAESVTSSPALSAAYVVLPVVLWYCGAFP